MKGQKLKRVGGIDITFSAPKSVSVAWALADDDTRRAIEQGQQQACEATIAFLERHAAFCRRGKNGLPLESAKLTVAAFHHGEARPVEHDDGRVYADPNLHTHAVLLNCSTRADGTVGALDARHLFANKMSAGSIYHLELSSNLTKIGFEIEKVGTNGVFEIVVPQNDGQEKEKGPKVQRAAGSFFRASERGRARHGRGRSVDRGGAGADCSGRPGESIIEK